MDEAQKDLSQSSEIKNFLPDVVHSQQISSLEAVVERNTDSEPDTTQQTGESQGNDIQDVEDVSATESISEHIPFKGEYSITESEAGQSTQHGLLKVEPNSAPVSKNSSLNIELSHQKNINSPNPQDTSRHSASWNLDANQSDVHISEESPVILALSSDTSKELLKTKSQSSSNHESEESPRSEYIDSLNDNSSHQSLHDKGNDDNFKEKSDLSTGKEPDSIEQCSSGSEDIIKLDIRGQAAPKFPFQAAKIFFGPPPDGSTIVGPNLEPLPVFQTLLSPCLVGANDGVTVEEVFEEKSESNVKEDSPDKSLTPSVCSGSDKIEQDVLIEEITFEDETKEKNNEGTTPPKSFAPEDMSLNTMSTDYKTICEEYHTKLVHLEEAIAHRDQLIEELTLSLQRAVRDRDGLKHENEHLANEVQSLQHVIAERSNSDHDTIKAQLSDYVKYQTMLKEDSTKFYSALMSGTTSLQSSNGEKDMDRDEITVNYSKSDLRSTGSSDEFQTGFENKLTSLLNTFEGYIEENLRNKLRESLIQVLCDEIGKMRVEYDTDVKELESQMKQEKQIYTKETRKLRELLSSVKAGNADISELRKELSIKHEKEMENLRTYFEKKCSDMERSYSEEVWRGRAAASPPPEPAAGDARRRTRSADLSACSFDACPTSTPIENTLKQTNKKLEQQLEDLKSEHIAYINELQARHKETVADLEEQITQLKAHIQTAENTEGNMSCLYQQDIDLELEKVLLSDPDAELSSWPLELVALRDRIHAEKPQDNESVRDEVSAGDADKWRRRRNCSFDQNRQLEEVTKERDGFKRVALSLQRAVAQLAAYCASAEHELNTTVLARLLADHDQSLDLSSRPSSPAEAGVRHVHFAPQLGVLAAPDADAALAFLQQQRDLSAHVRLELEQSLRRLRDEAHGLLALAARRADTQGRQESRMLEASSDTLPAPEELEYGACRSCQLLKTEMETALSECAEREALLRAELEAAALRIAQLLADAPHSDVIAEGYGTAAAAAAAGAACRSLDDASPRAQLGSLARELDAALRDRDDARLQLEAANRQLRSTRQFVEEQAAEREAERDEFAARLRDLRDDNARLAARLTTSARILAEVRGLRLAHCRCRQHDAHVEQLEAQTRDMNQIITELETRKAAADDELKATEEKITLLRDIIANLESQLEQKTAREAEVLEQLEEMKRTIEERDSKMRAVLGELESLRSERDDAACARCAGADARYARLVDKVKRQALRLERRVARRARLLERAHECGSASCSERTEDVSLRDTRLEAQCESGSGSGSSSGSGSEGAWSEGEAGEVGGAGGEAAGAALARVRARLAAAARAEDAALKRIADLEMQRKQLADVAQEVRAERDVLQARMSEQALRVSSLAARLQRQRNDAHALAHAAASDLGVRLHDAHAEVQRLKEELEVKDKQLSRLKQNLEGRDKNGDQQLPLYSDTCHQKERVAALERELCAAQARAAALQARLHDVMALKLEDEQNQKSEIIENKTSARTLSDIVSISDYDEQDMQMRRAEFKSQNNSLTNEIKDRTNPNKTLPPEVPRPSMSLDLEEAEAEDAPSPRASSLPAHLTSTQNRDTYKRNANEMTLFGTIDKFGDSVKHSTAQDIPDNCSMYPNRDVSDGKDISVEPKKINFSLEQSDNRTQDDEFTSLRELGITLDVKQENFPDILTQLKHEIKKSRSELEVCKSELKNAEEQLSEFPALKEEVEELKGLLENTMATMENDKKFYENQLESFSSNKKVLEQRLSELTEDAAEKAKDLHLLKEDILRRENMILELAKEKRNLTNKITELETKISELQSRNASLEKCEIENKQLRDKVNELKKLEQLVSEKNQQIDSLNQHLDRLDDLQRCLNDKTEEMENLKEALDEKSNELFQMQDSVATLNRDIAKVVEENDQLSYENKDLKQKLTKIEKEQENASLKLQNSESELERLNSLNKDLISRIDELKELNVKLKDKETEIEILNEDINSYHNEVALLKEQLKMVSRSPSPRGKGEERRPASDDRKQLVRIKKQISLLQHELDFQKKELNDKAFELAKAKLDATEARAGAAALAASERARAQLQDQLAAVSARLREESNISELKEKLRDKAEKCQELEAELANMREIVQRMQQPPAATGRARSPTAELERALRDQLDYSHALDEDIMDQILSASSDERDDIPMLALNSSNRSASSSSSPARARRLRAECERLQLQLGHLQARLGDKDALIAELTRVREAAEAEAAAARLRLQAERDHAARLALLLDAHKDSADTLHNQDSNMIELLKRRLEGAMRSEQEAQEREQALLRRAAALERALPPAAPAAPAAPAHHDDLLRQEKENSARLASEATLLRARLEREARRGAELQAALEAARAAAARDAAAHAQRAADLRAQLAELRRLKHETGVELARTKELLHTQSATIIQLEKKLNAGRNKSNDTFTEIEKEKCELAREMATLRRCLGDAPELLRLRQQLADKDQAIRFLHGRWARLESWRKALVWQKRFLQRQLAGYAALERRLRLPAAAPAARSAGLGRFRCVAWAAVATLRMGFLVRRREAARAAAASALLAPTPTPASAARHLLLTTPQSGTPVARRALRRDLRLALPASPTPTPTPADTPKHVHAISDSIRRLPLEVNSPLEEPFKLSSPRADAVAYLQRLDAAGRRLRGADRPPTDRRLTAD